MALTAFNHDVLTRGGQKARIIWAMSGFKRWNQYQQERFPLLRHALLVTVTTACVLAFAAQARGAGLEWRWLLPASLVGMLAFFQLRVLDEFKDADIDAEYRPERPVPRGLVTLAELRNLGLVAAGLQLLLVLALRPGVLPMLLACWGFMALMTAEFFVPEWLKARPGLYLLSHQPIVPLLQVLASAWDWAGNGRVMPTQALLWLAVVSFGAGITLEIGRKIYAPGMERPGVDTYTAAWGIPNALLAWLAGVSVACLGACLVSHGVWTVLPLLLWASAVWAARNFRQLRSVKEASMIENISAAVVVGSYLTLALGGRA